MPVYTTKIDIYETLHLFSPFSCFVHHQDGVFGTVTTSVSLRYINQCFILVIMG